jgi:hypothetical protein
MADLGLCFAASIPKPGYHLAAVTGDEGAQDLGGDVAGIIRTAVCQHHGKRRPLFVDQALLRLRPALEASCSGHRQSSHALRSDD